MCFEPVTLGPSIAKFQYDDFIEIEGIHEPRRLGGYDDLSINGALFDHAGDQADRGRMQAKFRFVQQQHVGKHIRGKVQQRHESKQT